MFASSEQTTLVPSHPETPDEKRQRMTSSGLNLTWCAGGIRA